MIPLFKHPLSPLGRRAWLALLLIVIVMTVGTVGVKALTGWDWVDSFYFMAMIATAQGPPNQPPNDFAKIFAAIMAFVSIGALVTAIGTIFGPYLGYLFHRGATFADKEIEKIEGERKAKDAREHDKTKQ
ncbi:MAG: hypothetical protein ACREBQ_10480 [Nitrososphaerales archaeon]